MAGPGRCICETSEEFDGSPILALRTRTPFTRAIFVESHAALADALEQRISREPRSPSAHVLRGDCNEPSVVRQARELLPSNGLSLAFVDMLGLDVRYATLQTLTQGYRVDLAITFQISDLRRNVENALTNSTHAQRFEAFFGTGDWRQTAWAHRSGATPFADLATAFTDFHEQRLRAIGYPHVARSLDVMKNSRNAEMYRLLLASRHPRAIDFFEKISEFNLYGEQRLF